MTASTISARRPTWPRSRRRPGRDRRTAAPRSAASGAATPQPYGQGYDPLRFDAVPLRLTRRGRRLARTVIVLLALLTALVLSVAARSSSVEAGNARPSVATTTVVVQPGQTLWTVARTIAPDADVRETVARIQGPQRPAPARRVRPGQQLVVPVIR